VVWGSHLLLVAIRVEPPDNVTIRPFNPWPFIVWTVLTEAGLLLASPFWWIMHRVGLRQWWWAVALALGMPLFLMAGAAIFILVRYRTIGLDDDAWMIAAGQLIGSCIVTSLVVWRTAYRRIPEQIEEVF